MTKPLLSKMLGLALFVAVSSACDSGTGVTGAEGNGPSSGDAKSSWLTGGWKGNYKNKEAEEGTTLRETTAEATFTETEALTGEFEIKLPALDNVSVKGIYHDFQGKSLLLEIKESSLSTIGSPNSSTDMDYDLVGDALELHNDRITIRLVRTAEEAADDEADDEAGKKKDVAIDDWLCRDGQGFNWKIDLKETSFALDVFDPDGARESLAMKGDVKITRGSTDADVVLTVTSSSEKDKYKGLELRGNTMGDNLMNLRRMITAQDGSKAVGEVMQCNTI